jgi:hypothetical protein
MNNIGSVDTKPVKLTAFVELHSRIGIALWQSQAFEDALVRFIVLILKLPPSRAEAEVLEILEKMQGKTLGALIAELRRGNSTNSVSKFERRVNAFLRERNWLVQTSWREHHTDLFNPERLPPLFARLDAIANDASALQRYFCDLITAWTLHQPGVTIEMIEGATQQTLKDRGVVG